jgi:hypothetical protein
VRLDVWHHNKKGGGSLPKRAVARHAQGKRRATKIIN